MYLAGSETGSHPAPAEKPGQAVARCYGEVLIFMCYKQTAANLGLCAGLAGSETGTHPAVAGCHGELLFLYVLNTNYRQQEIAHRAGHSQRLRQTVILYLFFVGRLLATGGKTIDKCINVDN